MAREVYIDVRNHATVAQRCVAGGARQIFAHTRLVRGGTVMLEPTSGLACIAILSLLGSIQVRNRLALYAASKILRGLPTSMVVICSSVTPRSFKAGITSL